MWRMNGLVDRSKLFTLQPYSAAICWASLLHARTLTELSDSRSSVLPRDTSAGRLEEPRITPASFRLVDDPLHLLSSSSIGPCTSTLFVIQFWRQLRTCCCVHDKQTGQVMRNINERLGLNTMLRYWYICGHTTHPVLSLRRDWIWSSKFSNLRKLIIKLCAQFIKQNMDMFITTNVLGQQ